MLRQLTPIPPVFYGIDPKFHRVSGITPPPLFFLRVIGIGIAATARRKTQ